MTTPLGWPRGGSPAAAREVLTAAIERSRDVMLRLRLRRGLPLGDLSPARADAARRALEDGLLDRRAYDGGPRGAHAAGPAARRRGGPRTRRVMFALPVT